MSIAEQLLKWYHAHGRTLPWRGTTDPYHILVSEIMLQQTQVSRGLIFYSKWLQTFPDWKTLARASNADVIHAWAGLGYNRRALMLRDIARQVMEHGVPTSEQAWRSLKGIGPYTAAALTVFSLHQPAVPIDTNIRRVLGRMFFGKPYPQPTDDIRIEKGFRKELQAIQQFYDVPQALFDLANGHCVKIPDCSLCPMNNVCKAAPKFLSGRVKPPTQMVKKAKETVHRNKKYPDRIYRGRILKLVREHGSFGPVSRVGPMIDTKYIQELDAAWVRAMIERLVRDGMLNIDQKEMLTL